MSNTEKSDLKERLITINGGGTILTNSAFSGSGKEEGDYVPQMENHSLYQKPLDLFMVCTNQDDLDGQLQPLNVYTPKISPQIDYLSNGQPFYHHFDENSYRDLSKLRRIGQNDGLIGYYSKKRLENVVQMLVCVTMYSEDRNFLEQTLFHIQKNLKGFQEIGVQDFQVVVSVIYDGITKTKEEVVEFYLELEREDNFDESRNLKLRRETIQNQIDYLEYSKQTYLIDSNEGLPPSIPKQLALFYQNRFQLCKEDKNNPDSNLKIVRPQDAEFDLNEPSLTLFSVFKHKNAKKLSSHLWFFEGLCRQIRPKYVCFVDVGTLPAEYGLVKFYKAMEGNDRIGGVCGFLGLEEPPEGDSSENFNEKTEYIEKYLKQQRERESQNEWNNEYQKVQQKNKEEKKNSSKVYSEDEIQQMYENHKHNFRSEQQQKHFDKNYLTSNIFLWIILSPYYLLKFILVSVLLQLIKNIGSLFASFFDKFLLIFSSLRQAQVYEYATGHIIDKNFDSFFGFMHVLPGAWSAYRYDALEVREFEKSNFMQDSYFKSVLNPELLTDDIKEANKFLAEDRILCLGIISAKRSNYQLKYIPDAYAVTDSPETLEEFIHQRRRWTNSMIFALLHVLDHYKASIKDSSHSGWYKKINLPINMFFARLGLINYIFLPALYLFVVLVSGYQFQIPLSREGKIFNDGTDNNHSCKSDYELKRNEIMCNSDVKTNCFIECTSQNNSPYRKIFNIFIQSFPFIVIITILLFIVVCLTIKMKKQNFGEFLALFKMVINQQDQQKIDDFRKELQEKQYKDKDIQAKTSTLLQKLGEKRLSELQLLFKSNKSHKLPKDLQKIKSEYDRLYTQKEFNKIYRIFASLISIENTILITIVSIGLYMNVFAPDTFSELGFNRLPEWMRTYILLILIINTGLFLIIMTFHFIFQPKLIWLCLKSYMSYLLYGPVYSIFLTVYSFCNLDDVTWGTKGLQNSNQNQIFVSEKVRYVKKWMIVNSTLLLGLLCGALIPLDKTPYVVLVVGIYGTAYNILRILGGTFHYLKYQIYDKLRVYSKMKKIREQNLQSSSYLKADYYNNISQQTKYEHQIQEELVNSNIESENHEEIVTSRMISRQYFGQNNENGIIFSKYES